METIRNINNPEWLNSHPAPYHSKILGAFQKDFFVVPKPIDDYPNAWNFSFHEIETEIIKNKACAKKAIKLLKYFRNCNAPLHEIFSSYTIKTIIMIMIRNSHPEVWNEKFLSKIFLQGCRIMRNTVKTIGSAYWLKKLNGE